MFTCIFFIFFFFSSRRRHTRSLRDWSSDVCSSDLIEATGALAARDDPTFVAQNLEVPTDSRLRKLEHCAQLPDHELSAIEQQKNPAARGIGERADTVEDGDGHEASGARC